MEKVVWLVQTVSEGWIDFDDEELAKRKFQSEKNWWKRYIDRGKKWGPCPVRLVRGEEIGGEE